MANPVSGYINSHCWRVLHYASLQGVCYTICVRACFAGDVFLWLTRFRVTSTLVVGAFCTVHRFKRCATQGLSMLVSLAGCEMCFCG